MTAAKPVWIDADLRLPVIATVFYRFRLLFVTSEAIERRPLLHRPRFMAAAWGGLLVCKLAAMVLLSVSAGLPMFLAILVGGALAVQFRFRRERRPPVLAVEARSPSLRATALPAGR